MASQAQLRLERNIAAYDSLVGLLHAFKRTAGHESTLVLTEAIAQFAANYHAGRFADGALENPAFEIGAALKQFSPEPGRTTGGAQSHRRRTILHVATGATLFGGVGRTILNWISADVQQRHLLALTKDHTVSPILEAAVTATGGRIVRLHGSLLDRAAAARSIAREADLIFLHHGRADIIPIVACATPDLPPVGLVNQADHTFWLGRSVTDVIVHQRVIGLPLSVERRSSPSNVSLPIPLRDPLEDVSPSASRQRAREALGIPSSQLMLASVGRAVKFIPNSNHNFFATLAKLLDRHRDAHAYIVGPTKDELLTFEPRADHPRIHFVGFQQDPSQFVAACDLYVESFPFGSQTSCLEACLGARPPLLAYAPESPVFVFHDESVADLLTNPTTETDYLEQASSILSDRSRRLALGEEVRDRVRKAHVGGDWLQQLHGVYSRMEQEQHRPAPLSEEPAGTTGYDVALASFLEAQAWRPLRARPERIRMSLLSEVTGSLLEGSAPGDSTTLIRQLWSRSRELGDIAVAAAVTADALPKYARRLKNVSREETRTPSAIQAVPAATAGASSVEPSDEPALVSVVMPAYNCERFLAAAVQSVLAQTYPHWELIIVDDGSSDRTLELARTYAHQHPARIRVVTQPNAGAAAARNTAIGMAQGSLVAFIDGDDEWMPTKLARQVPIFRQRPDVAFVYTGYRLVNSTGQAIAEVLPDPRFEGDVCERLWTEDNAIVGGTLIISRRLLREVGGFNGALKGAENLDLRLRLAQRGPVAFVNELLYDYRRYEGSLSTQQALMGDMHWQLIAAHFTGAAAGSPLHRRVLSRYWHRHGDSAFARAEYGPALRAYARAWRNSARRRALLVRVARCALGARGNAVIRRVKGATSLVVSRA